MMTRAMKCATTFAKWLAKHYLTDGKLKKILYKSFKVCYNA